MEATDFLIKNRFNQNITRVDFSKMCFSFDTLNHLFQNCPFIKSLVINFKYLQIKCGKFLVEQCIQQWPSNQLEKLYLKNVCDMKIRRLNYFHSNQINNSHSHQPTSYDLIEIEIIKLIRILLHKNSASLKVLGLKCVDPNVISSCVNDLNNVEILLLNNINDTDGVLQELACLCKNLKCLELNKCREFKGDGFQEILEQCEKLETLQLGKYIYPTQSELYEINWSILKDKLKEFSITTKFSVGNVDLFQPGDHYSSGSSNNSFKSSVASSSGSSSSSSSSPSLSSSIDLYSNTIFNYLNDSHKLEYLALQDFTLKFPANSEVSSVTCNNGANLKYLYLRNIRNIKVLNGGQLASLKSFLCFQYNLHTLDLIGLYLSSNFLCSILNNMNNLRVFYFGHGKSYKKNMTMPRYIRHHLAYHSSSSHNSNGLNQHDQVGNEIEIDIDQILGEIAENCLQLTHLGIFYRQNELKFKKDSNLECKNESLIDLLKKCVKIKEISYLKSFKVQQDDDEDENEENGSDYSESGEEIEEDNRHQKRKKHSNYLAKTSKREKLAKNKSYFHFIKYAIQTASTKSVHVSMRPCYGFDITPSSGHLLDTKNSLDFIETSLPKINPPQNDFHTHLLSV